MAGPHVSWGEPARIGSFVDASTKIVVWWMIHDAKFCLFIFAHVHVSYLYVFHASGVVPMPG